MKDDDDGDRLSCVGGWCEYNLGTNNDVTVMIINDYIIIIKYVNVIMYLYIQTHTHIHPRTYDEDELHPKVREGV